MMEKNGSTSSPRRRSVGVTVLGVVFTLIGGLYLLTYLKSLIIRIINGNFINYMTSLKVLENFLFTSAILSLFLVMLIVGVGLLRLTPWSRKLALSALPICISFTFFSYAYGVRHTIEYGFNKDVVVKDVGSFKNLLSVEKRVNKAVFIYATIGSVFFITPLLYYFTRPKVKALFSPERSEAESRGAV